MSGVRLQSITKSYGDFIALKDVNLEIREGEFITLLGASGSGKTTCLRTIAGFVKPNAGCVFIGNDDVTSIPSYRRNIGMVFQHYALFPHLTVTQNVAYGLKVRRLPKAEIKERTREALVLVHLDELADRYPKQLSGGQKQRVALARAVVIKPRLLLLDEPLGALDLKLREELQVEIRRVQQMLGITTLSVTHDQNEALSMSDRVVVMSEGCILQVDTPSNLYQRPSSVYVAKFVGRTNLLYARVLERESSGERHVLLLDGSERERLEVIGSQSGSFAPGDRCLVALRPENAMLGASLANKVGATVEKSTYLGNGWLLSCKCPPHQQIFVTLAASDNLPEVGAHVTISWAADRCLIFEPEDTPGEVAPAIPAQSGSAGSNFDTAHQKAGVHCAPVSETTSEAQNNRLTGRPHSRGKRGKAGGR